MEARTDRRSRRRFAPLRDDLFPAACSARLRAMESRLVSVAGRLARRHAFLLLIAAVFVFGAVFACSSSPSAEEARADAARRALLEKITLPIPLGQPLVVHGDVKVPPGEFVRPPLGAEGRQGVIV